MLVTDALIIAQCIQFWEGYKVKAALGRSSAALGCDV